MKFIVRLYDPSFGVKHHPSPQDFVGRAKHSITALQHYTDMFQIHNEPNHPSLYEGWGVSNEDALDFTHWYAEVLRLLKEQYPNLKFGFPGLAVPHRDLAWIRICREVIKESDWLGVHCYWQYKNYNSPDWGQRFWRYFDELGFVPETHILEAGNSNLQSGIPLEEKEMAEQLIHWYKTVEETEIIESASPFILSSQDPYWDKCGFTWITQDGRFKEIIYRLGDRNA